MMCVAGIAAGVTALGLGSASLAAPPGNVPCATGAAGLVAAINAANSAGSGTINLAAGCHYSLTTPDNGENGLPAVTSQIVMNGNGATIDGTGSVRILEVDGPSGSLTLQNVTLTGGSADFGGAIANMGGTVSLNHTQVTGNTATEAGGGIASATFDPSSVAKLTLNQSSVSDNAQTVDGNDGGLGGGGIVNLIGTATVNRSQVNGNTAQGFVGGGIASGDYMNFTDTSSVLTINGSQVDGNTAPNAGGGGVQNLLGSVTVNNSEVNGNSSLNGGGISSGSGGNPPPATSHLTVNNSRVDGNTATAVLVPGEGPPIAGGGIANGGDASLNNSEVDNNTASHVSGAGIVNHGKMTVNNSKVNGNVAAGSGVVASGGGIVNAQGPPGTIETVLTINNSQVNDNRAGGDGGGIANGVPFGGMGLPGGAVTLHNSQVTGNTATHGGGIFNSGGSVTLSNTAVTGNTPDNCFPPGTIAGCTG
jgi:predicted outer membrane repeat protein